MARLNNHLQYAQSTGGSPYDEEVSMPIQGRGNVDQSVLNALLNRRMEDRGLPPGYERFMSERIPHMMTPDGYANQLRGHGDVGGSDQDMMMMYGPEDQVFHDNNGRPIRLDDPRHPRNFPGGLFQGPKQTEPFGNLVRPQKR